MDKKDWIGVSVVSAMLAATAWAFDYMPSQQFGRPSSVAPGLTIRFKEGGEYRYSASYKVVAICTSRGDLLYLAESTLATSPSIAVVAGGCAGAAVADR